MIHERSEATSCFISEDEILSLRLTMGLGNRVENYAARSFLSVMPNSNALKS